MAALNVALWPRPKPSTCRIYAAHSRVYYLNLTYKAVVTQWDSVCQSQSE